MKRYMKNVYILMFLFGLIFIVNNTLYEEINDAKLLLEYVIKAGVVVPEIAILNLVYQRRYSILKILESTKLHILIIIFTVSLLIYGVYLVFTIDWWTEFNIHMIDKTIILLIYMFWMMIWISDKKDDDTIIFRSCMLTTVCWLTCYLLEARFISMLLIALFTAIFTITYLRTYCKGMHKIKKIWLGVIGAITNILMLLVAGVENINVTYYSRLTRDIIHLIATSRLFGFYQGDSDTMIFYRCLFFDQRQPITMVFYEFGIVAGLIYILIQVITIYMLIRIAGKLNRKAPLAFIGKFCTVWLIARLLLSNIFIFGLVPNLFVKTTFLGKIWVLDIAMIVYILFIYSKESMFAIKKEGDEER